jgi:hypothetical protein
MSDNNSNRKIIFKNKIITEESDNEYEYIYINNEFVWKNKIGTKKFYCNDFDDHESGIVKPSYIGEFRLYDIEGNMYSYGNVIDDNNWEKFEKDEFGIEGYSYQKGREVFHKDMIYDIITKYLLDENDNIIREDRKYTTVKMNIKTKEILESTNYDYTYIMKNKKPIEIIDNIKSGKLINTDKKIDNNFNNAYMNSETLPFLEIKTN